MEDTIPGLLLLLLLCGACFPEQGLTEHRHAVLETSTNGICRYGNRVDCCWGWTRESWGQCRPVCELGCKHGECVGPDQCRCHQGYTGKTCNQDVNECGLKPRPCKHRCMNMVGSYKCFCLTGYMMTHDGSCRNTRTCAMANCQYGCAVMKGEVMCQCPSPGLRLSPDRRTCVDIDECAMGMGKCPRFRKCVNTFGSYICKCHKGFELRIINGKYQCTDKNNPCHGKTDQKKCRCKHGSRGWSHECQFIMTVPVDPARPIPTSKPTTKVTTATLGMTTSLPTTSKKPVTTTVTMTTASTTTISPTTSTTLTTKPTTVPTSIAPTAVASTTVTTVPTTAPMSVAMTTAPSTVASTTPTMVATTTMPSTVSMTTMPSTVAMTTMPSTVAMTTMPTSVAMTTVPATITMTTMPTTITLATTTALPMTVQLITTTLDNRIWEITQRPRGDVHIPRNPEQNMFELDFDDIELGNTADIARDDPAAGSLSCSFDQGVCSWMTDQGGDLRWETEADPRGGRYLYVPELKTGRSFKGARLTIPLALHTTPSWEGRDLCLAFRYHLQGLLIGSLQVFVKNGWDSSPAIWTRTRGQGWRHTLITLRGRGIESVVIKGERQRGRSGEIAIDDLSIQRGVCCI